MYGCQFQRSESDFSGNLLVVQWNFHPDQAHAAYLEILGATLSNAAFS